MDQGSKIPWKLILSVFLLLRVITLTASLMGYAQIPFKPSFPYADAILAKYGHQLLWSWANFDGVHYIRLAQDGYVFELTQAFFPAYILLIRLVNILFQNMVVSGLLISHISFIFMLAMLYKLIRIDYSEKIARRVLIFISLFPSSFYFLSVYTESLFLLLLVSMFYYVRTAQIPKAAVCGFGMTLSRIVGILAIPSIILELKKDPHKKRGAIGLIIFSSMGLLLYMLYLWLEFKDPFLFAHVQSGFGSGRDTTKLVLFYQVIWRYVKMIFTVEKTNPIYFTIWLELISSAYALGLLIWAYIQKVRPSYLLFSFLSYLLPTLTGTFSSMPRYILVLFPIYIVLAQIKHAPLRWSLLAIHIFLLFICTMLFTRGYWIA